MFLLGLFIAFGSWVVSWSDHVKRELVVHVYYCTSDTCAKEATQQQMDAVARTATSSPLVKDVVFVSNFFEHLERAEILATLREAQRILRKGGRLIVLQPNIRYVGAAYWDFIDHHVALTERSLTEAASAAGFDVEHLVPRFLPYTTKSRVPQSSWLVRAYLRVPLAWRVLGKQTLLIARPAARKQMNGGR